MGVNGLQDALELLGKMVFSAILIFRWLVLSISTVQEQSQGQQAAEQHQLQRLTYGKF